MALSDQSDVSFRRLASRVTLGVALFICFALFLLWRIDNIRAERFRMAILDRVAPVAEWALQPMTYVTKLVLNIQSYDRIYTQNQNLREELQSMRAWREAAIQLEQENARLLDLNRVKPAGRLDYVSGRVLIDSGSRFRQTALINLGRLDNIKEGWATMDGLGLTGRVVGLGDDSARVLLVTDSNSRIPVQIAPSNQRAILTGDNSLAPSLAFIEDVDQIRPGDRVVTSGDGGVFPAGLLVGQVAKAADGSFRVILSADLKRLEFLRVIRYEASDPVSDPRTITGEAKRDLPVEEILR